MDKYIKDSDIYDIVMSQFCASSDETEAALNAIIEVTRALPPADVRPVVTCAECDWHVDCGYHFCNKWCQPCPDNADFYCAYGERPTAGLT